MQVHYHFHKIAKKWRKWFFERFWLIETSKLHKHRLCNFTCRKHTLCHVTMCDENRCTFCKILTNLAVPITCLMHTGWPKHKPLPNDQKIVLYRITTCEW